MKRCVAKAYARRESARIAEASARIAAGKRALQSLYCRRQKGAPKPVLPQAKGRFKARIAAGKRAFFQKVPDPKKYCIGAQKTMSVEI